MRTVGVDLASQPAKTAICTIEWAGGAANVEALGLGRLNGRILDDRELLAAMRLADKAAIDAPFGWPAPFIRAVASTDWPYPPGSERAQLERRTTDIVVYQRTTKLPLSVTTDRIAYCAMRCAALLTTLSAPRDGSGLAVEVYPDAALRCWLPELFVDNRQSYKTKSNLAARARREQLLHGLLSELGAGFVMSEQQRDDVTHSDDCLDALVCALLARAAALGETVAPDSPEHRDLAAIEGWIHLPRAGSIGRLLSPARGSDTAAFRGDEDSTGSLASAPSR
ncbi:DUF429 domain-containing protein [Mycolicibacterium sp.]|uniref:DUF429 domain-containing protein n=1 Tax=Mycolicibacterium sp. TaxID=2320850 RepID=UPI0037CC5EEC